MTTPSNTPSSPPGDSQPIPPAVRSATRPILTSVRRELWENRSVVIAPLAVAAVFLFGFSVSLITLPRRMAAALAIDPTHRALDIAMPYSASAVALVATAFIVGVFYCLDALYGERRDRSILFWKSLPLSDRATILSKASIPLVVLPLIVFVLVLALQLLMLLSSTAVLLGNAPAVAALWTQVRLASFSLTLLYGLVALALWHAPIYGWLLLVSGWARRVPFLWALAPIVIAVFERIAFRTAYLPTLLCHRVIGGFTQAFSVATPCGLICDPLTPLTPLRFLGTPGLWIGLVVAAAFFAAAVRLRRSREPI